MLLIFPAQTLAVCHFHHTSLGVNHWEAQNVPYCISIPHTLAFSHLSCITPTHPSDLPLTSPPLGSLLHLSKAGMPKSLSLTPPLTHCLLPPVSTFVSLWQASEGQRMIYSFVSHQPVEQCQRLL